ncbi:hypothetical protein CI109_106469 [Kwoniella shandongensis]|uniref:Uncharacterized protein n=1 Tax=Kwoniella shandongensis TaxID=1734106 RepID=A0A5M6C1K4_9TREE|nr:uncharacterized protein CI109_002651 [Kwoniella shandongensis]KAA5528894.1 hypothetical protein CI109_002651 [Kwoniella shandongensis]
MALPQSLTFLRQGTGAQVLEVYLDPLCPFSAKITRSLNANVIPLLSKGGKYDGKLSLIPRLYAQPFHYFGPFHIEALLVFGKQYPDLFWDYLLAIYEHQEDFFNQRASNSTPSQARDNLVHLAVSVLESKGKAKGPQSKVFGELRDRLENKSSPNGGNEAMDGLKHNLKIGRQNGIHVTPTVLFDGLKEDSVSSSWGKEEWEKFLSEKFSS